MTAGRDALVKGLLEMRSRFEVGHHDYEVIASAIAHITAPAEAPVADDGGRFVSISVGGSTHTRTADEWLTLARADLSRQQDARSVREAVAWAVERWNAEVRDRPIVNKHRRSLDDVWRQVIRKFGGDPDALIGPSHDYLAAHPAEPAGKGSAHE